MFVHQVLSQHKKNVQSRRCKQPFFKAATNPTFCSPHLGSRFFLIKKKSQVLKIFRRWHRQADASGGQEVSTNRQGPRRGTEELPAAVVVLHLLVGFQRCNTNIHKFDLVQNQTKTWTSTIFCRTIMEPDGGFYTVLQVSRFDDQRVDSMIIWMPSIVAGMLKHVARRFLRGFVPVLRYLPSYNRPWDSCDPFNWKTGSLWFESGSMDFERFAEWISSGLVKDHAQVCWNHDRRRVTLKQMVFFVKRKGIATEWFDTGNLDGLYILKSFF